MVLHQIVSLSGIFASVFVTAPQRAFPIRESNISIKRAHPLINGISETIADSAPYTSIFKALSAITDIAAVSIPGNMEDAKEKVAIVRVIIARALGEISAPSVFKRVITVTMETKAVPPLEITIESGVTVEEILFCTPRFERERDSPRREEAKMFPLTKAVIKPLKPLPIIAYGFFFNFVNIA